ncbi:MAG TPA: hypothetical protein VM243_13870 [Phycisphaerae bacterium]|nr:hypothetical protein [Phycisphaerae bacterium]
MEEQSQEFMAVDETGTEHRLLVYRDYVSAATRANPSGMAPGLKRIVTQEGERVNRLKKGAYQIVATGAILRSCDPDAP